MNLEERCKKARLDAGLTQEELRDAINAIPGNDKPIKQSSLSRIETGDRKHSFYLPHIAIVTGVSLEWLLFGIGPQYIEADEEWGKLGSSLTDSMKKAAISLIRGLRK